MLIEPAFKKMEFQGMRQLNYAVQIVSTALKKLKVSAI